MSAGLVWEDLLVPSASGAEPYAAGSAVQPPGTFVVIDGVPAQSQLLWVLAGVVPALRGRVLVDGVVVSDLAGARAAGVSLTPEGLGLALTLTAYENVLVPLLTLPDAAARAARALEALGLAEVADHLVEELSGGQQQRVAVARALAGPARVLLLEEPTSALDEANRHRVLALLTARAAEGCVVVVTSNDPEVARAATVRL